MRLILDSRGESACCRGYKERREGACLAYPCFCYCLLSYRHPPPLPLFEPPSLFIVAMVQLVDPVPWGKSVTDQAFLESLVATEILRRSPIRRGRSGSLRG